MTIVKNISHFLSLFSSKLSRIKIRISIAGNFSLGVAAAVLLSACGSMPWDAEEPPKQDWVKYSEVPQILVPTDRNYKRMNRQKFEEDSDLQASAGSLWKMDGQTSYLFTQNQTRQEGDPLKVKVVQPLLRQAETKVAVINDLLKELEEEKARQEQSKGEEDTMATRGPASEKKTGPAAASADPKNKKDVPPDLKELENIPTRIVEKLPDGNLRIRGVQNMMIRNRPFRVHLTGIVKPEDFNDEGLSSDKIIDPELDIVGVRKTRTFDSEEESVQKEM